MIVITGPGRSGTSALARLYKELGFDPGGIWGEERRAGLERAEFWKLNNLIAKDLGVTMVKASRQAEPAGSEDAESARPRRRGRLGRAAGKSQGSGRRSGTRVRLPKWDRFDAVVATHRDAMMDLATRYPFVKDPRFSYTLGVWLAAGVPVEHVTITTRDVSSMVASRADAKLTNLSESDLRNTLTFGLGMLLATVHEYDVSHAWVRFPDFLQDLDGLYAALRFPEPVTFERFSEAAHLVFDRSQVHDWATSGS